MLNRLLKKNMRERDGGCTVKERKTGEQMRVGTRRTISQLQITTCVSRGRRKLGR